MLGHRTPNEEKAISHTISWAADINLPNCGCFLHIALGFWPHSFVCPSGQQLSVGFKMSPSQSAYEPDDGFQGELEHILPPLQGCG